MAELMNSRTRIWAHINLSFFRPHSTPSKSVFWPPFPHRSSVCMSLLLMLLSCSPTFLPLLLLSCSSASWPGSFHCWYFFFSLLFPIWVMEAQLASSLILSCDNHHPCLKKSLLLHISHFGLTSKLKKVTDDGMNLFSMQMMSWDEWLYISVFELLTIHFYHCLFNMSSCKIEYFNLQAWLRSWRMNVKILNSKVKAHPLGYGLLEDRVISCMSLCPQFLLWAMGNEWRHKWTPVLALNLLVFTIIFLEQRTSW